MLKGGVDALPKVSLDKTGSSKPEFIGALASGLNRRAFLRQSSIAVLFSTLAGCKPNIPKGEISESKGDSLSEEKLSERKAPAFLSDIYIFDQHQKDTLVVVQMILFPDDGDGPSATDINALSYLEWTLTDPDNDADGDGDFIAQGIGWLDSLSEQTQGSQFIKLKAEQQNKVLTQISQSSAGENWMSMLIYYLMEALLFDPVYGGNPNGIGWTWLNHQPGFPAPDEKANYRNFL